MLIIYKYHNIKKYWEMEITAKEYEIHREVEEGEETYDSCEDSDSIECNDEDYNE